MSQAEELDVEELFHVALEASRTDRHEQAITALKKAVKLQPQGARQHYLLGAEYAQIGLYDRAMAEFAETVRLAPDLHIARFQQGLLLLTSGKAADALTALAPLANLGAQEPLRFFAVGLTKLTEDRFAEAIEALEEGIRLNAANPALSADMRALIDRIKAATQTSGTATAPAVAGHLLLNTYATKPQ
jgi:tetratricopeptide (TPR) repeat protein